MAACFSFLVLFQIHTEATCDLSVSSEISHTSDADGSLHSFQPAAAESSLSPLRQVCLSCPQDHLICTVALISKQNEDCNSRKFYGLQIVTDLVDLVI